MYEVQRLAHSRSELCTANGSCVRVYAILYCCICTYLRPEPLRVVLLPPLVGWLLVSCHLKAIVFFFANASHDKLMQTQILPVPHDHHSLHKNKAPVQCCPSCDSLLRISYMYTMRVYCFTSRKGIYVAYCRSSHSRPQLHNGLCHLY